MRHYKQIKAPDTCKYCVSFNICKDEETECTITGNPTKADNEACREFRSIQKL